MTDTPTGVFQALAAVAAELGGIDKSERNTEQNFNFRSIDAIAGAVRPLFGKHGLSVVPHIESVEYSDVESRRGTKGYRCVAWVNYTICHADGSSVEVRMVGEAVDFGDKSTSKAIQMAYKYMLTELCMVGAGDRDPDSQTVEEMGRPAQLTETEIAEKATNRLKADILGLVGDRDRAVALWHTVAGLFGYDPDGIIPQGDHQAILDAVRTRLDTGPDELDELTDAERAELEAPFEVTADA